MTPGDLSTEVMTAVELLDEAPPREEPDELERFWTLATDGQLAEAYAGLAELRSARYDLPLRLYWLLVLQPSLDSRRSRHDWLAEALARSRLRGPAIELYRRELDLEPALAVGGAYRNILAQPAAAEDLIALARLRIAAAGKTEQYLIIEADLRCVKPQLAAESAASWLSLLVTANDWAAWDVPPQLKAYCEQEIAAVKHLELQHAHYFDRIAAAEKVGHDSRAARWQGEQIPEEFARIVHANWAGHGTVTPAELEAGLAHLAADPGVFLSRFDRLTEKRGPGFALLAIDLLERHTPRREPEYPPELLRSVAHAEIAAGLQYDSQRPTILRMLLRERVHPEELADALAADTEKRYRKLGERLHGDSSLRILWLANTLHSSAAD